MAVWLIVTVWPVVAVKDVASFACAVKSTVNTADPPKADIVA